MQLPLPYYDALEHRETLIVNIIYPLKFLVLFAGKKWPEDNLAPVTRAPKLFNSHRSKHQQQALMQRFDKFGTILNP